MTKVRGNNNGIIFLDHQKKKIPFLKAIERKAESRGNQSVQHMEYSPILFYFKLIYFWEAQGQT
jgi:hypothetical protein